MAMPYEHTYPSSFRSSVVKLLLVNINRHQSVELIGMKRVGISNFLKFFLYNEQVQKKRPKNLLFIPIDLNNLIERELRPFWLLTYKRIVDSVEFSDLPEKVKTQISEEFEKAIQHNEVFFIVDGIRKALAYITANNVTPVLFMIRFDRILDIISKEMFSNFLGFYDASGGKSVCVFTTYRTLSELKPDIFDRNTMSIFAQPIYLQPAVEKDIETICTTFELSYSVKIKSSLKKRLLELCGGHVNYLQLSLIIYREIIKKKLTDDEILANIMQDERIILQSEELFSNLSKPEQKVLVQVAHGEPVSLIDEQNAKYLWDTGMVKNGARPARVFSEFLQRYIASLDKDGLSAGKRTIGLHSPVDAGVPSDIYLTNKENALFNVLKEYLNHICERDTILDTVWAEYSAIGVSDWAVDRLVARLRKKLSDMKSPYSIKTIRTRGFMLIEK